MKLTRLYRGAAQTYIAITTLAVLHLIAQLLLVSVDAYGSRL